MTGDLFVPSSLDAAIAALETDLRADGGPQISTMRNYRFALLVYDKREEFSVRARIRSMTLRLESDGWRTLSIALHRLLLDRVRGLGDQEVRALIDRERRLHAKDPGRAHQHLRSKLGELIEGPEGLAADVEKQIEAFVSTVEDVDHSLVLLARAGAIYPYFRSSALLRHLGGRTRNVPVVLLYPGRKTERGLSFMDELPPDRDYRPRIYW